MSEEAESEGSFNTVTWIFVILYLILNWGAMDWVDMITLVEDRKELFLRTVVYTFPLNLSFGFSFILAISVKKYKQWHFLMSALFFTIITDLFNIFGWLKPAVDTSRGEEPYRRVYYLLVEYFEHYGLFDFLSSILIALYFTYVWHYEIRGAK